MTIRKRIARKKLRRAAEDEKWQKAHNLDWWSSKMRHQDFQRRYALEYKKLVRQERRLERRFKQLGGKS